MGAKVKCPQCGETGEKDQMVLIGKRYYHIGNCESAKRKEQKEGEDYKSLVQYLCNLSGVVEPNPMWLAIIKKYREDSNYTSKGIMLTVKYYYEQLNNPIRKDTNLLGIVPFYYQEAKENFIINAQRKKTTRQFFEENNQLVTREKITVRIKQNNDFRKKRLIDMSIFEQMESEDADVTN